MAPDLGRGVVTAQPQPDQCRQDPEWMLRPSSTNPEPSAACSRGFSVKECRCCREASARVSTNLFARDLDLSVTRHDATIGSRRCHASSLQCWSACVLVVFVAQSWPRPSGCSRSRGGRPLVKLGSCFQESVGSLPRILASQARQRGITAGLPCLHAPVPAFALLVGPPGWSAYSNLSTPRCESALSLVRGSLPSW